MPPGTPRRVFATDGAVVSAVTLWGGLPDGPGDVIGSGFWIPLDTELLAMAKPQRVIKKANHGKRPASSKARRAKRKLVRT